MQSFSFAFAGLRYLLTSEHNMWIHLAATASVVVAALALHLQAAEWLWLVAATGAVWTSEAFNTAIERLTDFVSELPDPRIGIVKDVAAAAVLVSAIAAALIGGIIFLPYLARLLT